MVRHSDVKDGFFLSHAGDSGAALVRLKGSF